MRMSLPFLHTTNNSPDVIQIRLQKPGDAPRTPAIPWNTTKTLTPPNADDAPCTPKLLCNTLTKKALTPTK
jgi:hypothetical protein